MEFEDEETFPESFFLCKCFKTFHLFPDLEERNLKTFILRAFGR